MAAASAAAAASSSVAMPVAESTAETRDPTNHVVVPSPEQHQHHHRPAGTPPVPVASANLVYEIDSSKPHPVFGRRVWICNDRCHVSPGWTASIWLTFVFGSAMALVATSVVDFQAAAAAGAGSLAGWIAATVVTELLGAVSLSYLWLAVCTDPGIIPPSTFYTDTDEGRQIAQQEQIELPEDTGAERVIVVEPKAAGGDKHRWVQHVCATCKVWRPPRSGHDWSDDVCVREFDHKCHITGALIGQRNFRYFTLFNTVATFFGVALVTIVIAAMAALYDWSTLSDSPLLQWRLAACIFVLIEALCGGGFSMFFCSQYLDYSCHNLTAKDMMGRYNVSKHIAQSEMEHGPGCRECLRRLYGEMPESKRPY